MTEIRKVSPATNKPCYDNARYYAIHITASQFKHKPRDASASVARSCYCEFAAIYHAISSKRCKLAPKLL